MWRDQPTHARAGSVLTPTEEGKGKGKKFGFNMRWGTVRRCVVCADSVQLHADDSFC